MSGLTPLLDKRRIERQSAEQALARAVVAHGAAVERAEQASAKLAEHVARAPVQAESSLATGLSVARAAAFAQRHADRTAQLKRVLVEASSARAQRAAELSAAQHALAEGTAGERAVTQHLARAEQSQQRARQRREQEARDEEAATRIFARKERPL
jgi:hypothetical protein